MMKNRSLIALFTLTCLLSNALSKSSESVDSIKPGRLHHLEHISGGNRSPESIFNELAEKYDLVAIFSAPWCGPCKALAPHLESLAPDMKNILFIKINTDAANCKAVATRYGIRGIPTIICFKKGGQLISNFPGGGFTKSALKTKILSLF